MNGFWRREQLLKKDDTYFEGDDTFTFMGVKLLKLLLKS